LKKESTQSHLVVITVSCIFVAVLLLIGLRVISYGYIPVDDAMRHAAKAISGKDWTDILALRPDVTMDSHVGWHKILEFVNFLTDCGVDGLVVFSVVFLFLFFAMIPFFLMKRPEAWLMTLLILWVANYSDLMRLFLGRPYIFTMGVVVFLGFVWPRFREKSIPWPSLIILTILIALATWIHCLWYMFALPVLCFFLAREWRAGFIVALCTLTGVALGMLMTGQPARFLLQTVGHFYHSLGDHALARQLVSEFQPFAGDQMALVAVLAIFIWRAFRNLDNWQSIRNPIFVLAVVSWILGFVVRRVWIDWGIPAVCVWMALELEIYLKETMDSSAWKRLGVTLAVSCALFFAITSDYGGRWTQSLSVQYLSLENPEHRKWLPDKGGIVYNDDMTLFYQIFYANPHAGWRYILGFEPTIMPPEDLQIYRKIQWNYGAPEAYKPWVQKMKPADRMILRRTAKPDIKDLEWNMTVAGVWIGRLSRK